MTALGVTKSTAPLMQHRAGAAPRRWATVASTWATVGLALGGLAVVGFASTDHLIASSFSAAMAGSHTGSTVRGTPSATISGSEDYWLSRRLPSGASPAAWVPPLASGDTISVAGGDGIARKLKVTGVREVSLGGLDAGTESRMLLIEARDEQSPGTPSVRLVLDEAFAASLKAGTNVARAL